MASAVKLVERYNEGATTYEMEREFGLSRETIRNRLKSEGVEMRRRGRRDENTEIMLRSRHYLPASQMGTDFGSREELDWRKRCEIDNRNFVAALNRFFARRGQ